MNICQILALNQLQIVKKNVSFNSNCIFCKDTMYLKLSFYIRSFKVYLSGQ